VTPRGLLPSLLAVAVGLVLSACLSPGTSEAAFTRPSLRQISRAANPSTTPCSEAQVKEGPVKEGPQCVVRAPIAVDSNNDLWALERGANAVDEFSPASASEPNAFLKRLSNGVSAIQSANTNDFYDLQKYDVETFSPAGVHLETWGEFENPAITIDNSTEPLKDPSACGTLPPPSSLEECSVYVTSSRGGDDFTGVEKFSSKGVPVEFSDAKKCEAEKCGYIEGSKITGAPPATECDFNKITPKEHFADLTETAITVDDEGDIYLQVTSCDSVLEYRPSGEFLRTFKFVGNNEVPRLEHIGQLRGVAFDPVSGHLLVALNGYNETGDLGSAGAIDEFEAATGKFVAQITKTPAGAELPGLGEIAVDSEGDVYAAASVPLGGAQFGVYVWGPGVYLPTLTLAAAGERKGESAVLDGTVNPEGLKLSQCQFQYVSEAAYAKEGFAKATSSECSPAASAIPTENKADAVKAGIGHLTPGTTYRYRLVATSEGALGGSVDSEPLAFTAPGAPMVLSSSVSNLSSTFADLNAQIDPAGAATTYHFEYLTTAAFAADGESFTGPDQATSVPLPEALIGLGGPTGGAGEAVSQHVGPLAPSTTYYYRVVAQNAQGVRAGAVCEGKATAVCTFATLPAAVPGLPDGRAYELVTPVRKEGGSDLFAESNVNGTFEDKHDTGVPAQSGNGFLLEAVSLFGPYPGSYFATYVFQRDPAKGEWTYTALVEPSLGPQSALYSVFEPEDFSRVAFNDNVGSVIGTGQQETSLVGPLGGPYTTLHVDPSLHALPGKPSEETKTRIVGASHDLDHVLLESNTPVGKTNVGCPGSTQIKHGHALCEWAGSYETTAAGEVKPALRLADVDSEGEPVSTCGALLGNDGAGGTHQAVSADGSHVFFIAPDPRGGQGAEGPGCWQSYGDNHNWSVPGGNAPQLYARIDATSTLELSLPEPGLIEAGSKEPHERPELYPTEFIGASEDGSKVFFVTDAWLTANHPQVHDPELYECEILEEVVEGKMAPKCRLTRISAGVAGEPGESEGAELFKVEAVANEGTAIYYTAFGALAPGASKLAVDNEPDSKKPVNLYRYQLPTATTAAQTNYIATLSTDNQSNQAECASQTSDGAKPCNEENWYTTPDGRYLLFYSEVDLTANAHAGGKCEIPGSQGNPGICGVLYRYDAQAAEKHEPPIVCVSCDPNGGVPTGTAEFTNAYAENEANAPVEAMSNDGSYVFFDTPTPLVPQATNGTLNVYEWHEGTISLINSGAEAGPSYFLGYSPYVTPKDETVEGGNVFFGTHQKLVAADTNRVGNIYDARVCVAESPCIQPPPGETAQCEGSSCQAQPAEPLDATPTSLSFDGPGDASSEVSPPAKTVTKKTAAKCKKGYVKKKNKCVKKPKSKKKAKKSSATRRVK
jgi:hypothetical protein